MQGESIYACSSKIVLNVLVYYYYLHFTYLIFHNIYQALGTNRLNLEHPVTEKESILAIPPTDNILVFIKLVTRMDRILSTRHYGKKSVHSFFLFRLDFLRPIENPVQKGGNRCRNFAYLRDRAQKAIICEITRTDT